MKTDSTTPPAAPTPENAPEAPGERLQNILSHRGVASRRHAAEMIATGQVSVNGAVVTEPGQRVDPATDDVRVNGELLAKETERPRTILLYKPRGLICSADNSRGETVCDLMRPFVPERIVPVGRLDRESEGLLLMSNDGELTHVLTHPRYGHSKTYIARVAGHMEERKIELLRSRMEIDGYVIQPVEVEILKVGRDHTHQLAFTLSEGRNRQIRKMCSQAGFTVLDLVRVRIGPFKIGAMQPGDWRELTDADVRSLKKPMPAHLKRPPLPQPGGARREQAPNRGDGRYTRDADNRPRRSDDRPQRSDDRPQRFDDRPQRFDDRPQRSDDRPRRFDGPGRPDRPRRDFRPR